MRRVLLAAAIAVVAVPMPARAAPREAPPLVGRLAVLEADWGVAVVQSDGSGRVELDLGRRSVGGAHHLTWSPDGTKLAFPDVYEGDGAFATALAVIDVATGQRDVVWTPSLVGGMSWSPDGRRLAYFSVDDAGDTVLRTAATGGCCQRTLLTADDVWAGRRPAWSADGRFVHVIRGDLPSLWRVPVTGGPARPLAPGATIRDVVVSPDGRHLAMCGTAAAGTGVLVARADGTGVRLVSSLRCGSDPYAGEDHLEGDVLAWSPDGRSLALVASDWGVHRIDVVTGSATRLGTVSARRSVSWSPGGTHVAVTGSAGGVWVVGADGTGEAMVPGTDGSYEVHFAPTP